MWTSAGCKRMRNLQLYLRFVVIVPLLASGRAAATTYVVKPDGTGHFPTIQEAVWACIDGDTVQLADGTFTGMLNRNIDFAGLAIVVESASGDPATCIIDCEGVLQEVRRALHFHSGEGPASIVRGITIQHGLAQTLALCLSVQWNGVEQGRGHGLRFPLLSDLRGLHL